MAFNGYPCAAIWQSIGALNQGVNATNPVNIYEMTVMSSRTEQPDATRSMRTDEPARRQPAETRTVTGVVHATTCLEH